MDLTFHIYYVRATKRNGEEIEGYIKWDGLSDLSPVMPNSDCSGHCVGYLSSLDTLHERTRIHKPS